MSSALRHPLPGDASRATHDVRLSVEQVSYAYSANPSQAPLFTLEATSFQARPGEIVAILGPNASGKSTLLKLIAGTQQPLSGRVLLNGFVVLGLPPFWQQVAVGAVLIGAVYFDQLRRRLRDR